MSSHVDSLGCFVLPSSSESGASNLCTQGTIKIFGTTRTTSTRGNPMRPDTKPGPSSGCDKFSFPDASPGPEDRTRTCRILRLEDHRCDKYFFPELMSEGPDAQVVDTGTPSTP